MEDSYNKEMAKMAKARIAELEAEVAHYVSQMQRDWDKIGDTQADAARLREAGDKLAEFVALTRKEGAELEVAREALLAWRLAGGGQSRHAQADPCVSAEAEVARLREALERITLAIREGSIRVGISPRSQARRWPGAGRSAGRN